MEPLAQHKGKVATLDRVNVDTDQIIPKQFLKRIERTGFGQFLFNDWRFLDDGSPNPEFSLNEPRFEGASILVTRNNFGCGSSREHAPWALLDYGFKVIIAPSFADIFYSNCFKNGILPVRVSEVDVKELFKRTDAQQGYSLTVDLHKMVINDDQGLQLSFETDDFGRKMLLEGLDHIGVTEVYTQDITRYEKERKDVYQQVFWS